jgi:radical SAM superfamily enzyme YgiQ (UPF0313 family)
MLYSNLGTGYIASLLKEMNHDVYFHDGNMQNIDKRYWSSFLPSARIDIFGLSMYEYNYFDSMMMLKLIKKYCGESFVFVGGYYPTFHYKDLMSNFEVIDCCVIGEGDTVCCELVDFLTNRSDWHDIKGIAYRNKLGQIISTG